MQQLINQISKEATSSEAEVLSALYDKYAPAVYGRIMQVIKQKEIAEKILEKVFIKALTKPELSSKTHLTPFTALLNQSRNKTYSTIKAMKVLKSLSCSYTSAS